jgi:peptidoglycan hydrolase-like protein with peptidoglycan-binding domain
MSNALSPWPVVQNGSQGHPIRTLQFLLRAHGHNLAVDGIFGAATEAAVKAFQTSKSMTADGIVAPQTWSALIIQVKKGNSGDAVRGVQEEFQFRSGEPGKGLKVDGIFRTANGQHGPRLPTRSIARHSICHRGWDCRSGHLAGIGQRHVVGIGSSKYVTTESCFTEACDGRT